MSKLSELVIGIAIIVLFAGVLILSVYTIDQEYRIQQLEYLVKK